MKLKNKLKMFEEFTSAEKNTETTIDSKGAVTTASNVTSILDDVDNILGNLETLSKQIDEEHATLLEDFEKASDSILKNSEMVNEDFMAEIMKQVNSMKSYAKLAALYPKMKQNILKAELNKKQELAEFESTKVEKTEGYKDKLKAAYKAKIDAISASDAPAIKKSQQKEALRQARDQAIEKGSDTVAKQLEAEKAKLTKQQDDKIRDLNTKITDLQNNNKIEAELLSKQWQVEKLKHDDQYEFDKIEKSLKIDLKYAADNPDRQKKLQDQSKASMAKVKEESKEAARERAEELAAIQQQFDAEAASGTEEQKEAKAKIVDWFKAGNAYASYLGSIDFGVEESTVSEAAELSDEVKNKIKELRKAYSDANAVVTVSTFKKAGSSEEDAKDQFTTFKKMVGDAVDQYSDQINTIDGLDDEPTPEPEPETTTTGGDPNPPAGGREAGQSVGDSDLTDTEREAKNSKEGKIRRYQDLIAKTNDEEKKRRYQEKINQLQAESLERFMDPEFISLIESELLMFESEINLETVTESAAFKSGSVADRFRRLL